jgi:signal peptidase I
MSNGVKAFLVVVGVLGLCVGVYAIYGFLTIDRYRVPSESMKPGTGVGTQVGLNTRAYSGDKHPAIGDIVIHHPPAGAEVNECGKRPPAGQMCAVPTSERSSVKFIKRVVAGPGDRVAMEDGHIVRNGKATREPYIAECGGIGACDFPTEFTVPADHYVMLGDNRGASDDSRFWGPVPERWILGRVEDCTLLWLACSPRS